MGDVCLRATHKEARLEIAVALTTELVREGKRLHGLAATSTVALGRLLTGTALLALTGKQEGSTSVQILSRSRIGSLYADCTHEGAVRGMTKSPHLAFPLTDAERETTRRSLAPAVFPGRISVIRRMASGRYAQSATPLVSGEIDEDLESYLAVSDQNPTLLVCDVVLDELQAERAVSGANVDGWAGFARPGPEAEVAKAGGVFVHAMPDGDRAVLEELEQSLRRGGLARALASIESSEALLERVMPEAVRVEAPTRIRYQCRCSRERVLATLHMFSVTDLAEMVAANESVEVGCDLCGRKYRVEPTDLRRAFEELIKAHG